MADDWVNGRHYECLIDACALLLSVKDDRSSRLNEAAIEFIRQSASDLQKVSDDDARERSPACSFCGKAEPEVRLGAGPDVFICNECVAIFHPLLCANREDSPSEG